MAERLGLVKAVRLARSKATLADLPDRLAALYGRRTALTLDAPLRLHVFTGSELSFADVLDVVARLAGGLRGLGVGPGDRVAICTANRIDYALTLFAVARAGGIAVPLHHHLKPGEVESLCVRSKARFLVSDPEAAVTRRGLTTIPAGRGGALDRAAAAAAPLPPETLREDDPVAILFTSGTTGAPKGATLTSRSLLAVARLAALYPEAAEEHGVCALPQAHVMGLSTLLCSLIAGARLHWIAKFDPERVLSAIAVQRATFFVGVPAMYSLMADAAADADLSSVKLWASGADAMPPPLVEYFRSRGCALASPIGSRVLTAAFAEIYGMVELSGPAILKLHPALPRAGRITAPIRAGLSRARKLVERLPGVAGRLPAGGGGNAAFGIPIPPYRVRIVGDDGKPVKAGAVGELVIRGPGVTAGYDRDPEATRRTTRDGWLFTGDLARKNRLGLIAFATRKKDVIKHGGFSVFPAEVEAQLAAHPWIAEAVVFGAPHRAKGAVPVAAVVLARGAKTTEGELLAWCRENIAPFKSPRAIAIVGASDIPRNANRKVLKDALRETLLPRMAPALDERPVSAPRGRRR